MADKTIDETTDLDLENPNWKTIVEFLDSLEKPTAAESKPAVIEPRTAALTDAESLESLFGPLFG